MGRLQRVHVHFSGHVQGVGYRNFVRRQAIRLELTGWIKNLPDGRVESVIEGYMDNIDILIQKCRRGPSLSKVNNVNIIREPFTGEFSNFEIRY